MARQRANGAAFQASGAHGMTRVLQDVWRGHIHLGRSGVRGLCWAAPAVIRVRAVASLRRCHKLWKVPISRLDSFEYERWLSCNDEFEGQHHACYELGSLQSNKRVDQVMHTSQSLSKDLTA